MTIQPSPKSPQLPELVEGVDVDAVYTAILGCPGVAGLGSGQIGAMTTYLRGRRLPGIRVTSEAIELEVRMAWGASAAEIGTAIGRAVQPLAPAHRLEVSVADIELPGRPASPEGEIT